MQKNNDICCVIFYDNIKYDELAKLAHDSFLNFHKNEVDIHFITPYNIDTYQIKNYTEYPKIIGIEKYIRGYDVMINYKYKKLIIIDVDTITCGRFDEFMENNSDDVLATLNYPLQESTKYWTTPILNIKDSSGSIIQEHVNLNAGVICINNPDALKKIIDISISHSTDFCEQSGLNELAWIDKSYTVKAIESPYYSSKVVYNSRSKGVPRTEMIKYGKIQNCWPNNVHSLSKDWLHSKGLIDGQPSPIKRWYVNNNKLYTEDHKNIKCFHFIEAIGMQDIGKFHNLIYDFKVNWFNKETIDFFKKSCNVGSFFDLYYDVFNKKNKFKIIIPSYNNEKWVEYNVSSIINQTYENYDVLYIDDDSVDNTYSKVVEIVKNLPNWKVIKNSENKGATYNYVEYLDDFCKDDYDIIIHLDGDDWLIDENVLQKLNDFYNERDCWMTYGGFLCWDGKSDLASTPYPQSTEYSKFVHDYKLYRIDDWRASHLRTFRSFLFKKIDKLDLKSKIDGKYYWHASDLAWQFPSLEMCGEYKIGLVDFYTYIYNQSESNKDRTKIRESKDNVKYEIEIRGKKKYKSGLSGEKLPQVNVFGLDYYMEYNNIPKEFSYCYEQTDGDFDMVLICDRYILDYLDGKIKINKKVPIVAKLYEQRDYFQKRIYNSILKNYNKFDYILTYDRELLKLLPNAIFSPQTEITQFNRLPNPFNINPFKSEIINTYDLPKSAFQIYSKSKLVSAISSAKSFLPGHTKRLDFIKSIENKVDLFGRGFSRELVSKLDGLREYMFSVAIENISTANDNYFSEKILDCFLTGTIPIYHGCLNIHEFFDIRGILTFETKEELNNIINNLSPKLYESMSEYISNNYNKCFEYPLNNDMIYDSYYKKIIEKNINII